MSTSNNAGSDGRPPNPGADHRLALVLVVEDDADSLWLIASGLKARYMVLEAVNGQEGLEKARETAPDLVVTDLMMPTMNGIDLCRMLKSSPETSHIPVIMLTARSSVENKIEGLHVGADAYISKPFDISLLEAQIDNLLTSRERLREQFSDEFPTRDWLVPGREVEKEFLEEAIRALRENLSNPSYRSQKLAGSLNMSIRSLQRKLTAVAGRSPARFICAFRMREAARMLVNSPRAISEIAVAVGYEDQSNFSKAFKQQFGVTPREYRSVHRRGGHGEKDAHGRKQEVDG